MGTRRGRLADHSASEWDALAYDRLSQPQIAWGKRVLERLELAGNETVVDAGCGSGRLTQLLLDRLPSGRVLAIDRSRAMLTQAESQLRNYRDRVQFVCADLTTLKLAETVDAVFSTATFHWIRDHDALFGALARTLKPAGKLEAQCGGGPNLARLRARVAKATVSLGLGQYFHKWEEPWLFATPQETDTRLTRAGFTEIWTTLEPAPVTFESKHIRRLHTKHRHLAPPDAATAGLPRSAARRGRNPNNPGRTGVRLGLLETQHHRAAVTVTPTAERRECRALLSGCSSLWIEGRLECNDVAAD
jgi:trans-aconitate 2-methyltransferase